MVVTYARLPVWHPVVVCNQFAMMASTEVVQCSGLRRYMAAVQSAIAGRQQEALRSAPQPRASALSPLGVG